VLQKSEEDYSSNDETVKGPAPEEQVDALLKQNLALLEEVQYWRTKADEKGPNVNARRKSDSSDATWNVMRFLEK
jgi:hypothetical protein